MLTYFPNFFSKVNLWNRTKSRAENLRDELIKMFPGVSIEVVDDSNHCVNDADVVVTATGSSSAIFGASDLKKLNVHINGEMDLIWGSFVNYVTKQNEKFTIF